MGEFVGAIDDEFREFVAATGPALLKTARLLTGDWHLGEDLLQATFAKVYRHWGRAGQWDSPLAYTRTAMVNTYCTWRRRRWHREVAHSSPGEHTAAQDVAEEVAAADALGRALMTLGRRERAVVVLRYFEDLSVAQTAEVLNCRPGTVTSLASRALGRLRQDACLGRTRELEGR
jgi:RNA polymerase sigma-70 factor (sigma-E family)